MNPDEKERSVDDRPNNDWPNDAWLDAALTQYGQAEPRPGLENRVLASLRAERERISARKWLWWSALAAVSAVFVIALGVVLASLNSYKAPVAKRNSASVEQKASVSDQAKSPRIQEAAGRRIRAGVSPPHPFHIVESAPVRLEQFPSRQPLSEQEAILARYVEQFPRHAGLMAQAQTQLTQEEMLELEAPPGSDF